MSRFFAMAGFVLFAFAAFGQGTGQKPAPENEFMSWVHSAWSTVQQEGPPAAQRLVRQFPKRFEDMKSTVAAISKKVHDAIESANLAQKRDLLVELWRVRKSLDMLTLVQPATLKALTGLDTSGLNSLEAQATSMCRSLTAAFHAHV